MDNYTWKFHTELTFLKRIFPKNDYPKSFIDNCFKTFLHNIHFVKENVPAAEKKHFSLVLLNLEVISLQTRTKLQQALKGALSCCKLELAFKYQTKLSNSFQLKDPLAKDLLSGVVCKLQCGVCNYSYYGECIRYLDIRSGEYKAVSPLTGKKLKPVINSAVLDHSLHCNYLSSFDNFSIWGHKNKKFLFETKESVLIIRDKSSINRSLK